MASLAPKVDLRVKAVSVDDDRLTVDLMDGRSIAVPLAWYPRLFEGTPDLDEDLSTEGLLRGAAAPRSAA